MAIYVICFIAGVAIGVLSGFTTAALCVAAKFGDSVKTEDNIHTSKTIDHEDSTDS